MRKAKLYQLLAVVGGLSTAVATTAVSAAEITLAVGSKQETTYTIELVGNDGNTWTYSIWRNGKRALSHWSLGIESCADKVSNPSGPGAYEEGQGGAGNADADMGVDFMIKWNTDVSEDSANPTLFSFDVDGDYNSMSVPVLAKAGNEGVVDSIEAPNCDSPVDDTPVEEPTDPVEEPTDPVEEPTDPVEEPTDPVEEPTSGGNPNMACEEITGSNGVPMSLIAKYETNDSGAYIFVEGSGTDIVNIEGNLSGGTWSVDGGVVKVGAIIVKGGTDTDVDQDGDDSFSNEGLVNGGNNTPDISNIQFCEVPVFDASEQVCLWSANKDADGNYTNIAQEGCMDAEEGKFYAIEAGGEFSSALEAE